MSVWLDGIPVVQWGVVIVVALIAALFDVTTRRIPNALTGPVFIAGLLWSAQARGVAGLGDALAGAILLAVPYVLLFVFASGGAGDAKLMGALGAWLGLANGVIALAAVALAGVVLSLGYALAKGRLQSVLRHLKEITALAWINLLARSKREDVRRAMPGTENMLAMPYGVSVLAGVCLAWGTMQLCSA